MESKKKICSCCSQLKHIWKTVKRNRFCKQCWLSHPDNIQHKPTVKQKPISHRSTRTAKEGKEYSLLRKDFMLTHTMCEAHLQGCNGEATDVHHTFWGASRSTYFLDVSTWKSCCRFCHQIIHSSMSAEEAIQLGLKNFKKI